ncbi:MAG: CapA family protein [Actinobacteria bacterium]|nr:CapA family protein [Actinomycetota bacterium]
MKKFKRKNNFSILLFIASIFLIIFMFFNLNSCSIAESQIAEKPASGNSDAQGSNDLNNGANENGDGSLADKQNEEQKQTLILIKNNIPSFIAAILKHEISNNFNNSAVVMEDGIVADSSDYDVVAEIARPESKSKNFIIFCAVTNFYNSCDNISIEEFKNYWDGSSSVIKALSEAVQGGKQVSNTGSDKSSSLTESSASDAESSTEETILYIDEETEKIASAVFGDPKNSNIKITESTKIKDSLENNPNSFAVIPFDELRKELKVLNIDGRSVFDKDFSYENYPFSFSVNFSGNDSEKAEKLKALFEDAFYSNRNPDKIAVVNMTGVTAMVRGVANRMDTKGVLYPGEKIADILKNADITHISNEISFKENCNAGQNGTTFCSKPQYIELLKSVGADLIELTGNHLNDYGSQYLESTLKTYESLGWKYFGGGANLAKSKMPALYEINGNKIAFLGFNQFGPSYDWATRASAGSAPPDNPYYINEIKRLKEQGYNVIFTFQYEESYSYFPLESQITDFRMMRDAGADIISGSQAHQPMGFEMTREGLICYGLGNLFFDQMQSSETRQGIIVKHVFYNGKHISTQFIPTIIDDYCQPRLMDEAEKAEFYKLLYNASHKISLQ